MITIDIHETRRVNLKALIERDAQGNISGFAKKYGYTRAQVSQYLSDTYNDGRSIGERAARAIEEAARVDQGFLDRTEKQIAGSASITEKLDQIIALLQNRETRDDRLWSSKQIAEWLGLSTISVEQRVAKRPDFPAALRPVGTSQAQRRWFASDVIAWARNSLSRD
ncbi:hypothetical protein B0G84_5032 [Paraburkholderia sp. BL8N3]|nr:hypothetical protein B0G84_5032 [Paraburkholderia sp. BL8N3]